MCFSRPLHSRVMRSCSAVACLDRLSRTTDSALVCAYHRPRPSPRPSATASRRSPCPASDRAAWCPTTTPPTWRPRPPTRPSKPPCSPITWFRCAFCTPSSPTISCGRARAHRRLVPRPRTSASTALAARRSSWAARRRGAPRCTSPGNAPCRRNRTASCRSATKRAPLRPTHPVWRMWAACCAPCVLRCVTASTASLATASSVVCFCIRRWLRMPTTRPPAR
mmetsp:Transcript_15322/g.39035  ORF Transcript_15322/g.39035 Transcript_15322/m.39035 type:complete len:223 (+) Transcript_15322:1696-2364(+)